MPEPKLAVVDLAEKQVELTAIADKALDGTALTVEELQKLVLGVWQPYRPGK